MHDPSGKPIVGYLFGSTLFDIKGEKRPRIHGFNADSFASETELLTEYDQSGQGIDLYRLYADGSKVKLRPNPTM